MKFMYGVINVLIFLLLAPLLEGIIRKVTARVQARKGPPVIQPYLDLIKLFGKENMDASGYKTFQWAPVLAFASIICVVAFMPLGGRAGVLSMQGDIITIVYLLTLGGVAVLLGALSSRNTFALIGASREMITMIMVEPVLAMTLIIAAIKAQSLNLAVVINGNINGFTISLVVMLFAYILALQAFVARQPFDIAEAEQEILEGPFIEYSGPNYALFKYYMMIKQMFYASLLGVMFLPFITTGIYALNVLIHLGMTGVVFLFIALIGSTNPRLRIDQAVKYYAVLIVISLVSVGLTVKGL
jgi:formate hydrogenlyase subunit 4